MNEQAGNGKQTTGKRSRSRWRKLGWLSAAVIVLALLAYFAFPPLARHYSIALLEDLLGRPVALEAVSFNPFTATARIRGLHIHTADRAASAFSFDELEVDFEPVQSVWQRGLVIHSLTLARPRLEVEIDASGGHSWADVLARLEALGREEDKPDEDDGGFGFSVGNVRIFAGRIGVDDRMRAVSHELAEFELGLPFISNLPVKVDVFVEPSLSAVLDGNPLLLNGRLKPFADSHESVLDVVLDRFDLAPWLVYSPFKLPVELASAQLSSQLEIAFRQEANGVPVLQLRGPVKVDNFLVQLNAEEPLLRVDELALELADVQPFIERWYFTRLQVVRPEIDLVRLKEGDFQFERLLAALNAEVTREIAADPGVEEADEAVEAAEQAQRPGQGSADFLLAQGRIIDGVVRFSDRSLAEEFSTRIEAINLELSQLATDPGTTAELELSYATEAGEQFSHQDRLRLQPFSLEGQLELEALQPPRYAPYLAQVLPAAELRTARIDGKLRYQLGGDAKDESGQAGNDLQARLWVDELSLRDFVLALKGAKEAAVELPLLAIREGEIDPQARHVRLQGLEVQNARLALARERNGDIDLLRLLPGEPAGAAKDGGAAEASWLVEVGRLAVEAASVRLVDRTVRRPAVITADGINLIVDGFSTARDVRSQLKLDSRINRNGRLAISGDFALEPLQANLGIDANSIDLLAAQPYIPAEIKLGIARGRLGGKGQFRLATTKRGKMSAGYKGSLRIDNFASVDRLNASDFVRWRSLRLNGIDGELEPLALAVNSIALEGFYSRLILDSEGRLNLREIQGQGSAGETASTTPAPAQQQPLPPLRIGRIDFKDGNVAFSDRFIRPNYDVNLTDLGGRLEGLRTDSDALAQLELDGKVDRAAPVTIRGEFNPFREDLRLDINAAVDGFELSGLSTYSGKYVGYGISRGKLSAKLEYKVEERQLSATNQVFLDQLTFGDKVDSPDATNLPVQLAVSLLKNSRGEIDLHLPVSGTLDDPEFSVFGIVVKMLVNLIGKAITAPFALLGSVLGGGEELSHLDLAAGSTSIEAAQAEKLATLAQALIDRPALRLEVTGHADPERDIDGLKQARLLELVKAQKLKTLVRKGEEAPSLDEIEVGDDEYDELLRRAYRQAKFKKPTNVIGLTKELPREEMETLILDHVEAGDEELRALALQRAQAVRDWLMEEGSVPAERIFVLEPKVEAGSEHAPIEFSLR